MNAKQRSFISAVCHCIATANSFAVLSQFAIYDIHETNKACPAASAGADATLKNVEIEDLAVVSHVLHLQLAHEAQLNSGACELNVCNFTTLLHCLTRYKMLQITYTNFIYAFIDLLIYTLHQFIWFRYCNITVLRILVGTTYGFTILAINKSILVHSKYE